MPGKEVIGVVFDLRREGTILKVQISYFRISQIFINYAFDSLFDLDAGEYVCPKTTVFGLKRDEVAALIDQGLKVHDKNPEMEGQEIETSGYNVSLLLFEKQEKYLLVGRFS